LNSLFILNLVPNSVVIFLTAKNGLADKVTGLKSGAEDNIVKPFETVELLARIEIVLR
jgi:two-component system, OmpR family, alkaline phosphatase synthesis response regulator PhoP